MYRKALYFCKVVALLTTTVMATKMRENRRDVEFPTLDGTILRGWFYPASENSTTVIISHGFACLKEWLLPELASSLQSENIASLVYDHRNFGSSSGKPRQEINSELQSGDLHDAVSFLLSLPEVRADRIGLIGYSLSAAHATKAAALDRRIGAVISISTFLRGDWLLDLSSMDRPTMDARIWTDRDRRREGGKADYFPIVRGPENASNPILSVPDSEEFYPRMRTISPEWKNEVSVQSTLWMRGYAVNHYMTVLAPTNFLMLVDRAGITQGAGGYEAMYALVGDAVGMVKEFFVVEGVGHFDILEEGKGLGKVVELSVSFLQRAFK